MLQKVTRLQEDQTTLSAEGKPYQRRRRFTSFLFSLLVLSSAWIGITTYPNSLSQVLYAADGEQPASGGMTVFLRSLSAAPNAPVLAITKSGPASVRAGAPLVYTLTIRNVGDQAATDLVITDSLPDGAHYVGSSHGGVLTNGVATWSVASLPANNSVVRRLTITATQAITNAIYGVSAAGGHSAVGAEAVVTQIDPPYLVATTHRDFLLPGTQPGTLVEPIPDPTECLACHTEPIYGAWRGSMMGQAGRDPLFWAALAVANQDAKDAGEFCLRCHGVKGWLEGRSQVTDGSALQPADIDAGIACEVCHRMVDPKPSTDPTDQAKAVDLAVRQALTMTPPVDHVSSAMFIIDPEDNRRGPFDIALTGVTHSFLQTAFLGQSKDYVTEARLCGTCHNIDNPALSWDESRQQYWPNELDTPAPSFARGDLYPIESTYDEWLNSDYPKGVYAPQFAGAKADGIVGSCQDCHMPRTTGIAAEDIHQPIERDCETTGCLPRHTLMGGNTWVPQLLKDTRWRLHSSEDAEQLDLAVIGAREMLTKAATMTATLTYVGVDKVATVRVTNQTGHKLPTGYAEGRRMWLQLVAYNAANEVIYTSGAYNAATGELTLDPAIKVYEVHQGLTPELAELLKLDAGPSFHFVLNNTVYKDNRIPPRGYTQAAYDQPGLRPVEATYVDGQHWDETTYPVSADTVRVEAKLFYQTASKEYIDFLRDRSADGAVLGQLWDTSKSPPELMVAATANLSGAPMTPTPTPTPTATPIVTPTSTPIGNTNATLYLPVVTK